MDSQHSVLTLRTSDGAVLQIECHDSLPDTAKLAREYAHAGYPDRYCVFTEHETEKAPEGQKGKVGDGRRGVFVSVILRPHFFPTQAGFLGELTAVALVSALSQHTATPLQIGWVSDVFAQNKKVASATMEAMVDGFGGYEYLLLHFAVQPDASVFPPRLSDMIKQVFTASDATPGYLIAKSILTEVFRLYPFVREPEKFMDEYRFHFAMRGVPVHFFDGTKNRAAKILGISPQDGSLLIEFHDGSVRTVMGKAALTFPKRMHLHRRDED